MKILNNDELDNWLFEHVQVKGNMCIGLKNKDGLNIGWMDTKTKERIFIQYEESNQDKQEGNLEKLSKNKWIKKKENNKQRIEM